MHHRVQGKVNVPIVMQQTRTSSSRDEEKWQHLGCILKAKSRGFVDALDGMGVEGKNQMKNYF